MEEYIDKTKGIENHGDIIGNKYVLLKKIGYGSYCVVWLGYLLDTTVSDINKKFYAIKVCHEEDYEVCCEESKFLNNLHAFGIETVKLYETLYMTPLNSRVENRSVCMVFELLTCSLFDLKSYYSDGFGEKNSLRIIKTLCENLQILLDNNFIHTDIRSDNVLIKSNNDRMNEFCKIFHSLNYDLEWKELCKKMVEDEGFNLTNKKHKIKYNFLKRKVSIKKIRKIVDEIEDKVCDIDKNIKFDISTPIYLADYGTVEPVLPKNTEYHVQSRNYKSPEILLHLPYTYKIDVWALGCLLYEILTGEYLIDPDENENYSINEVHLYCLVELLGDVPLDMTREPYARKYFKKNGKFKHEITDKWSIEMSLNKDCKEHVSDFTIKLIKDMVQYNPKLRPSFKDIINRINEFNLSSA